ncbi:hypothetical protein BT93_F2731 [Corymbia citriodora subsp. variegata]|nr:hypothetical protein BT93_F2731 [Corymbia citriodora subsp. variegata]
MDVTRTSMMHHVCIVLFALWLLSKFDRCTPLAYFVSFIYLYLVHEHFIMRLQKKMQFEEMRQSIQRKVLTDYETVRWLNYAVEKIWPVCMEQITSQKILRPIIPWFLEKYKPWTAKNALVQHLYLGRNPPIFTEMRVLHQSSEDDHLVLELGMNFLTADDMSAILAVQLRKRLGFGMWAKLHLTSMHVEGKVLIGIKFIPRWPFLGRLRVCFAEPPYFQMTVKPIFTHGIDVTEIPGIDGWLDNLLSVAFEETLVEPNMLVVDVEKFAGPPSQESWFSIDVKAVAYAKVEIIEGTEMKPSDLNGLADPYVKGQMGRYRFKTKIQKKTLAPKWLEEFKIPILMWDSPNILNFEVCDKDHIFDDALGTCSINFNDLRDGQRHDIWVPLENIKMGRLHVAVTILERHQKEDGHQPDGERLTEETKRDSFATDATNKDSFSSLSSEKSSKVADKFEPIDVDGQKETAVWIQQPGSEVLQTWEPRKGKGRRLDTEIQSEPNDASSCNSSNRNTSFSNGDGIINENVDDKQSTNPIQRGMRKIGSLFHRNSKVEHQNSMSREVLPSPRANIRSINSKKINLIIEGEAIAGPVSATAPQEGLANSDGSSCESPSRGHRKRDKAKNLFKQAEKSAHAMKHVLSRKGSNKFKGDSSAAAAGNGSSQSDYSEDDSLSPSHIPSMNGTIQIESRQICLGDSSNENRISADASDQTKDMGNLSEDTNVQCPGRTEDEENRSSNGSIEGKSVEVEPKAVISVGVPEEKVLSFDEQKA